MRNGTCSHTTRTAAESREREARAELCAGQQHLSTHEAALASSSTMYNNPSAREWWHAHPSGAHHTHLSHTCLTLVSYVSHTCLTLVSYCLILVSYLPHTCTCLILVLHLSGCNRANQILVLSHTCPTNTLLSRRARQCRSRQASSIYGGAFELCLSAQKKSFWGPCLSFVVAL